MIVKLKLCIMYGNLFYLFKFSKLSIKKRYVAWKKAAYEGIK